MSAESNEPPVHVTTNEARGGQTPHIVRYVLGISLVLVIVGFIIASFVAR